MGIYTDTSVIYGVRILEANEDGSYHVQQEFAVTSSPSWKEDAQRALALYEASATKKIQVLYRCGTSYDKDSAEESFFLWVDTTLPLAELL
jgi:hypothetical protein